MSTNKTPPADTLGMTADEMRALGHAMVNLVVDHLTSRSTEPVVEITTRPALEAKIGGPVPRAPGSATEAMAQLHRDIIPNMQHGDHPRYFARVASPSSFTGILGDWMATGFNAIATSWLGGSGTAITELVVLEWLRELLGMPEGTQGIIASGGSMANFTAFAAAFAMKGRGIVYLNDQTHSSLKRNLTAAGLDPADLRVLKTNAQQRYDMDALRRAIQDDRAAGKTPVMVIASAGTTNTGAVDPLREISDLCRRETLWMHIDGAYGAPAAFTDQGKDYLDGIALADSLVLDPHKWLFQPYDCGCVLVRHQGALERAFSMNPEYLKDVMGGQGEVDLFNRSLELSRKSRALKLWLTFKTHGIDRICAAISKGIATAELAQRLIENDGETWEVTSPAQIGIVTFARRGAGSKDHAAMVNGITASGFATLSSTEIGGRSVLRLCTLNPLTTEDDLAQTLARLKALPIRGA